MKFSPALLARAVRQAGEHELAAVESDKILILKPDHIGVRMTRATQALEAGRLDDAYGDIELVLANPGLVAYLRDEPRIFAQLQNPGHRTFLELLHDASRRYFRHGRFKHGRIIAENALELARMLDRSVGPSHYNLARAYADSANDDASFIHRAAEQLFRAFVAHPLYKDRYIKDSTFDAIRGQIDAILDDKPDAKEEYQRRLSAMSQIVSP